MTIPTRVAVYARYSSDRQSETSAEDQARLCRDHAIREGWQVVEVFADLAISGATRNRPGLNALLDRAGEFNVVVAEALDRISRDQEDVANIFKRLRFAGVEIVTLSEGQISELHIGLKGTMSALFLKDLGEKTRRGQLGRVVKGRIPGGISYGYDRILSLKADGEPDRGLRSINDDQAKVVRRIFAEYLAGLSTRTIAQGLNEDSIAGPSGGLWRASTINGNRERANGILNNELYSGVITYNRQSFVRDPLTRKRVARPNPPELWVRTPIPELAIIDEATWCAVVARQGRNIVRPAQMQRRPKRLLSGLLRCGQCGGSYTIIGTNQWGCSTRREAGTCSNNRSIMNAPLERRVLAALRERMLAPDAVEAFVDEYRRVIAADHALARTERLDLERKRREASTRIERLTLAIADGAKGFAEIRTLLEAQIQERERCNLALKEIDAEPVFLLHPGIADAYRKNVEALGETLGGTSLELAEARNALRNLLDRVVVSPSSTAR